MTMTTLRSKAFVFFNFNLFGCFLKDFSLAFVILGVVMFLLLGCATVPPPQQKVVVQQIFKRVPQAYPNPETLHKEAR
jgi:hypothetical protein